MSDNLHFEDALDQSLDCIDRALATSGVILTRRPLYAAIEFVDTFVIEVITSGKVATKPGALEEYVNSEWFKVVYARTVAWYSGRYGEAMKRDNSRLLRGVVTILGTPFLINVPVITREPGRPGETIWICYHDRVKESEDSLSWIVAGPNVANIPRSDGMKARREANEVAGTLRASYVNLISATAPDLQAGQLRDAILPHLEQAADGIVRSRPEDLKRSQWDVQMACELSLKLLAQQQAGTFEATHDLFVLFDRIPTEKLPFPRHRLSCVPHWEKMVEWRYGGGSSISLAEAFRSYRTALKIVAAAASAADRKYNFSQAKFEIRKAPYLHDDPLMFEPRQTPLDES
ncbi:hypothetical protein U8607_06485 [Methylobacterium durans]|uniref:hypothetical protein n=1 Tax=Methylobacterium durans TaxID=2202825 RepID=UPI002AFDDDC2|nr:hypothetical protein [Methylobacterium durans]MEA1831728.1 hypothetical protein [Methylobacterium durans]